MSVGEEEENRAGLAAPRPLRRRLHAPTRLEAFTDAAFAFTVTLLVISAGALPGSIDELARDLRAVPAFAASFATLAMFWWGHCTWSRRYALQTPTAVLLTLALVLTVLVWVYPLRMIMTATFHWISAGWLTATFAIDSPGDLQLIYTVYGGGFALLSLLLALLYRHAHGRRAELGLDARGILDARESEREWLVIGGVALLSVAAALALPLALARLPRGLASALPGLVYFLIGPALVLSGRAHARLRSRLDATAAAEPHPATAGDGAVAR